MSERHANFIVNSGNATAAEIWSLVERVSAECTNGLASPSNSRSVCLVSGRRETALKRWGVGEQRRPSGCRVDILYRVAFVSVGRKNATLKLMAAALMVPGHTVLRNVPSIRDVHVMTGVLSGLGAKVSWRGDRGAGN